MGRILCKKHGTQAFYEMCVHCYADVTRGVKSKVHTIAILNLKICDDCYREHTFKEIENIELDEVLKLSDDKVNTIEMLIFQKYNSIEKKGICIKCYEDINIL
ncbi:hypothetical protein U8527_05850 [Kordia algicida OT-1]|uniref:Uncharacterized protein n=1 Tax=Kordia algicida OT-1 TaxID=391587 RepID=A9E0V3_9FLAO|nr:hypothetical protein [Kordia algicida]EDP95547.1 hypothetical protein KAOT1_21886 [Kordia algicida OT-1]